MAIIVNVAQMRAIETEADRKGTSYDRMMDDAGEAVFSNTLRRHGPVGNRRVVVLCGSGNNGGDGLVAAGHFARSGADVRVYLVATRKDSDPRRQTAVEAGAIVETAEKEAGLNGLLVG